MEGFEHVCKVALESENFVVASNLKFPVARQTRKLTREVQTHGYEVDLVGARNGCLVLASVKSFFGSGGVSCDGFRGLAKKESNKFKRYLLFNDPDIQHGVIAKAAEFFGYAESEVQLRLYVGKFRSEEDRRRIEEHLGKERDGFRTAEVIGIERIIDQIRNVAKRKMYQNDPVVMMMKALRYEERLKNKPDKRSKSRD